MNGLYSNTGWTKSVVRYVLMASNPDMNGFTTRNQYVHRRNRPKNRLIYRAGPEKTPLQQ